MNLGCRTFQQNQPGCKTFVDSQTLGLPVKLTNLGNNQHKGKIGKVLSKNNLITLIPCLQLLSFSLKDTKCKIRIS